MAKPRITQYRPAVPGGATWICRAPGPDADIGVGYTPRDAYIDWLSSLSLWDRFRLWVASW